VISVISVANSENRFDVIVVGGGPAGASAATHLTVAGARVLVVERERFPREKLCGEFISPECFAHFARLGVEGEMGTAGGVRVGETKFFSAGGREAVVPSGWFGEGDAELCALGLSRAEMDARLLARARAAGAEVREGARAAGLVWEAGRVAGVRVAREGAERVCCAAVVIDATGRARSLAQGVEKFSGGKASGNRRARLVAFKAHLEGARGAGGACEIYFYRGGYGGLNGVEGGLSNLCFIAAAEDVRACASDPERVVREVLMRNRRAAETLRDARAVGGWLAVALERFGRFSTAPATGLVAIGDAASFIDPFTGSGMLMALESGELAARAIARHLPRLKGDETGTAFAALADEYAACYREKFGARLRVCSALRRAAFAPAWATEASVRALGASATARRALARATRGGGKREGRRR
jgi:flavin-dependent dehydrogenase